MRPSVQEYADDLDKSKGSEGQSRQIGRKKKKGDSSEKSDSATKLWAENRAKS